MAVTVADEGGTISIDDGNAITYVAKDKVFIEAVGNNVRVGWDNVHYIEFPYTDFTAPSGGSAAVVAAAIEVFLDTNPSQGIGGSGTLNYIMKFTPDGQTAGDSLLFDNGTTVQMGATGALPSAQFALTSTTQGFLAPRMTTTQRDNINSPATGLFIYNTSTNLFNYYNGVTWDALDAGTADFTNGGNAFGADATLGLTDNFDLSIITNNLTRVFVKDDGLVGINQSTPLAQLHIVGGSATTALRIDTDTINFAVFIANTGNVGISNSAPGAPLDVGGAIRVSGTGGNGKIELLGQASGPSAPSTGVTIYGDAVSDRFAWIPASGFGIILDQFGLTANRAYTFPDASVQLAGVAAALATGSIPFADSSGLLAQDNTGLFFDNTNKGLAVGVSNATSITLDGVSVNAVYSGSSNTIKAQFALRAHNSVAAASASYVGAVGRGTIASPTVIVTGDDIITMAAYGYDGTDYQSSARIIMTAEGTIGNNQVPGRMTFWTASSVGTLTERMRIDMAGNVGVGDTSPASAILSATSVTKGFLTPRMTATQRDAIGSPATGLLVYNTDTNLFNYYNAAAWVTLAGPVSTTLTDGATINWALKYMDVAKVTLGGNRTMAAPTNIVAGGIYRLYVIQDGTGTRTITWNSVFKWPAGVAPTLTTTAAAVDMFLFCSYDGTNLYCENGAFDIK